MDFPDGTLHERPALWDSEGDRLAIGRKTDVAQPQFGLAPLDHLSVISEKWRWSDIAKTDSCEDGQ
jgi:hypothetical protein